MSTLCFFIRWGRTHGCLATTVWLLTGALMYASNRSMAAADLTLYLFIAMPLIMFNVGAWITNDYLRENNLRATDLKLILSILFFGMLLAPIVITLSSLYWMNHGCVKIFSAVSSRLRTCSHRLLRSHDRFTRSYAQLLKIYHRAQRDNDEPLIAHACSGLTLIEHVRQGLTAPDHELSGYDLDAPWHTYSHRQVAAIRRAIKHQARIR